jgi:hypothetical protein
MKFVAAYGEALGGMIIVPFGKPKTKKWRGNPFVARSFRDARRVRPST